MSLPKITKKLSYFMKNTKTLLITIKEEALL